VSFLYIIIFGLILSFISVFLLGGYPEARTCMAFLWIIGIAFIIVYGSIFVKTARVWYIYETGMKLKGIKPIPDWLLLLAIVGLLIPELTILAVWTAVSYPSVQFVYSSALLKPGESNIQCVHRYWVPLISTYMSYKALLVLLGCVISWKIRKIQSKLFNESKHIGFMMYNLLVFGTILVAILFAITLGVEAYNAIASVLICWIAYSSLIVTFATKMYSGVTEAQKSSSRSGNSNIQSGSSAQTNTSPEHS